MHLHCWIKTCATFLALLLASNAWSTGPPPSIKDAVELRALGSALFHDKRLSADGRVSCASCHQADRAFTDGLPVSKGVAQQQGTRNAPSLLNVVFHDSFFWDGRRASLVEQVVDPFLSAREHGLASAEDLLSRVARQKAYRVRFAAAFDDPTPSISKLAASIAAFIESLDAGPNRFDRYLLTGDKTALSNAESRGYEIFKGPGQCISCHAIGDKGAHLTDNQFHAVSINTEKLTSSLAATASRAMTARPKELALLVTSDTSIAALGRFTVTRKPADIGKYRTPSLRQVAITAPYMHDGSIATLEEAIEHEVYYRSTQQGRPVILTPKERSDLAAFLRALTSESIERPKRIQQ